MIILLMLITLIPTLLPLYDLMLRLMTKVTLILVPECSSDQLVSKSQDWPLLPSWSQTLLSTQAQPLLFLYSSYHLVLSLTFL